MGMRTGITKGINSDVNIYDQPPETYRNSLNGTVTHVGGNEYLWQVIKGTEYQFKLSQSEHLMGWCKLRNRKFILTLAFSDSGDYVTLSELIVDENNDITKTYIWSGLNIYLNLSIDFPFTSMFGFYENEDIQRIYFSDNNNPPRVINVGSGGSISINPKFVSFFPVVEKVYGNFEFLSIVSGGNLLAGSYFFAWRFYKEGYYTDWSYLTAPVHVTGSIKGTSFTDYQEWQGEAPDKNTSKSMKIRLTDLDTDYDEIQVCAFYSNDFNSAQPGRIIYNGDLASATMEFVFKGSENLGTVTIEDLMATSISIERVKNMIPIKKMNVVSNIKEREELDTGADHPDGRGDEMIVDIEPIVFKIFLDDTGYPTSSWTPDTKSLHSPKNNRSRLTSKGLEEDVWYKAINELTYSNSADGPYTIPAGNYFKPGNTPTFAVGSSSTDIAYAIVKKKYRKASAAPPYDINTDYVFEAIDMDDSEFMSYKEPKVANSVRGYPSKEKIRTGVLFFDKTGRPFFTRFLNNENTVYGPGDTTMPSRRYADGAYINLLDLDDHTGNGIFDTVKANALGLSISGLDITSIKDKIGAFMIVRAPIVRQYIAYGALVNTIGIGNDIYTHPVFWAHNSDVNHYAGAYGFYCPEDIFELTDFNIEPGDELENEMYYKPYYPEEVLHTDFLGVGRQESPGNGGYSYYQKFYQRTTSDVTNPNGELGVAHEILFYTRYRLGDGDDISIDPRDQTKLFKQTSAEYEHDTQNRLGYNTNLGIAILDIDETGVGGEDIKGKFDLPSTDPQILICAVKRENNNPYGGTGESALSNTVYMGTGHFQIVDPEFIANIKSGAEYIVNEIEIFGGDTFIDIFDINRLITNEDQPVAQFNHSILFPIETRVNIGMREGRHIAKDRSYYDPGNPVGLRYVADNHQWEEFNYNDGYSSANIQDYYLPLPFNFQPISKYDTRFRYSIQKNYGEIVDVFRQFLMGNSVDAATELGPVNNIKPKFNRLVYWQEDAVGYIPIRERDLRLNQLGQPVQIGVGGEFERYDELVEQIGNSNHFGLVEHPGGFVWYDAKRKIFFSLDNKLKLTPDSVIKGLDNYFSENIPEVLGYDPSSYDNPLSLAIYGGYDPHLRQVFYTFNLPGVGNDFRGTVIIDPKKNVFVGYHTIVPMTYIDHKDLLFTIRKDENVQKVYRHNTGPRGNYYDSFHGASIEVILVPEDKLADIFDNWIVNGNDKFFDYITYKNDYILITETLSGSRNYKFRNRSWYGNVVRYLRQRLIDRYLSMTFGISESKDVKFKDIAMITRKMF